MIHLDVYIYILLLFLGFVGIYFIARIIREGRDYLEDTLGWYARQLKISEDDLAAWRTEQAKLIYEEALKAQAHTATSTTTVKHKWIMKGEK